MNKYVALLFLLTGIASCKKNPDVDKKNNGGPGLYTSVSVTYPGVPNEDAAKVTVVVAPTGTAKNNHIDVDVNHTNQYVLGKGNSDDILFVGLVKEGKVELSHENTALSISKLLVYPYRQSKEDVTKVLQAIRAQPSFLKLVNEIGGQVRLGRSPLDSDVVLQLAMGVAAGANETLSNARLSRVLEAEKVFFFGEKSLLAGQSAWLELDPAKKEAKVFNDTRLNWQFSLEDAEGRRVDEKVIGSTEFADDFKKISSYIYLTNNVAATYSDRFRATIFQTPALQGRHFATVVTSLISILIDVLPWETYGDCSKSVADKIVGEVWPKFLDLMVLCKTPQDRIALVGDTFFSTNSLPLYEGAFGTIMACKSGAPTGYMETLRFYSKDFSKLLVKVFRVVKNLETVGKVGKFAEFVYQFASEYSSSYTIARGLEYLSFKVNGVPYQFDNSRVTTFGSNIAFYSEKFDANNVRTAYGWVDFNPRGLYKGAGTYEFGTNYTGSVLSYIGFQASFDGEFLASTASRVTYSNYSPQSGFVRVLKDDGKYAEGVFEFVIGNHPEGHSTYWFTPNIVVTEGKFRSKY